MERIPGTRVLLVPILVPILVLILAGCAVSPPEGAYFDVDHHPVGAVPAQAGFYAGAYIVAPPIIVLTYPFSVLRTVWLSPVALMGKEGREAWDKDREARTAPNMAERCGIFFGAILGAPFHFLALPFGSRGGAGDGDAGPPAVEESDWDDRPPCVPRDYPWPPKLAR